jgi:putative nucleotidyltransferase with HDIG domain
MKSILFVDDEPLLLQGLKAGLYSRRKDWSMQFAEGGARGIQLMEESHFDVLVTDLRMPRVDGTMVVDHARTHSPDTIRIVLSGYADEDQAQRLVSLAHRYLSKPCEPKRLEECIDRCLATRSLIKSDALRTRLGAIGALPPMPSTFAAIQVAGIIQKDPAVCAKVLQVCNSAFFRLPRRVSNVQQAVSYLGLSNVRSMVLSAEVFRPGKALPPGVDLGQLQRHSLNVAAIARSLAADMAWADDAFLAGLLHDVGILILGRQYPAEMQKVFESHAAGVPLAEAERAHLGVDHGSAGAYLLGLWGLPYEVVDTVANHEAPTRIEQSSFDGLSAVAVAHALLETLRSSDVPRYEAGAPLLGDEYLVSLKYPHPWAALLERANALLSAAEGA